MEQLQQQNLLKIAALAHIDFNGVEGMSGVRGSVDGQIETESNDYLMRNSRVTDADPNGTWVGFSGGGTHFGCYKTTGGNIKCAKI